MLEKKYTIHFILFELLLISQVFLARTIFNKLQIFCELLLGIFMLIQIWKIRFSKKEELMIIIFLVSSVLSFVFNDLKVFLLNFKIFSLAILSLIYFSRVNIKMRLINIAMWINIAIFLFQFITGVNIMSGFLDQYGSVFSSNYPRPVGLFLSPHESAYLMGIFLLYFLTKIRFSYFGIFPIFITFVAFVTAGYIIQIFNNFLAKTKLIKLYISRLPATLFNILFLIFIILFSSVVLLYSYNINIQNAINEYEYPFLIGYFDFGRIVGIQVVVEQLLSINTYKYIFAIIPRSYEFIQGDSFSTLNNGNEVMFFQLMQQGGIVLFLFFLNLLLKKTNHFRSFILICLLHYGDITTPLAVCMLLTYSYKMNLNNLDSITQKNHAYK